MAGRLRRTNLVGPIGSPPVAGSTTPVRAGTTSGLFFRRRAARRRAGGPDRRAGPPGSSASSSRPRRMVSTFRPVIRDRWRSPPWPILALSTAAYQRRCCSSSRLIRRFIIAEPSCHVMLQSGCRPFPRPGTNCPDLGLREPAVTQGRSRARRIETALPPRRASTSPQSVPASRPSRRGTGEARQMGGDARQRTADGFKEQELLPDFLTDVFCGVLGYSRAVDDKELYTFSREKHVQVDGKFADAVLGAFRPGDERFVVAVEGKGPKDPLDRPFAGGRCRPSTRDTATPSTSPATGSSSPRCGRPASITRARTSTPTSDSTPANSPRRRPA